ncbi:MAG TPA: hypothetical protein DGR79_02665 [Clostridiales bacterium]|nr:hypothetical protein [Clostridiales bacterium]
MSSEAARRRPFLQTLSLVVVGVPGLAAIIWFTPVTLREADAVLLIFIAMGIVSEWAHVPLARGAISLSYAVVLPAFVLYGPGGAILCEVVGYLVGHALFDTRGWRVKLFNVAQYAVTCAAAALAFELAGGARTVRLAGSDLLALMVFTLVYFAVNHVLVGLWLTFSHPEESARVIWEDPAKWEGLTYLITGPLGIAFIMLYSAQGLEVAVALFVVSLAAAFVLRFALQLERRNRELGTLYEAAQELSCELDLDAVKGRVLEAARRLAPSDIAALVLWDDLDQVLRCSAAVPEGSRVEGACYRLGEGVVGRVAERKVVEVVDRPDGDRTDDGLGGLEARSLVVVPLTAEGNLVGVLVLGAGEAGRYTEEHVRLLTIFAGQAGAALSRAARYQETCQMAITDSRTGVYNYRFFYERLVDEMRRHRSKNRPLSVIFLDLDHLKDINDRFGHQVGDEVLAQVASLIAANVRETDEVARYGGEEFVVLLPGATGEMSVAVAERIRGAVEGHDFATRFDLGPVRVTVTAGVATYPEHAAEPDELILRADEAMYQGKHRGRNRVFLYTPVETACEPGPA